MTAKARLPLTKFLTAIKREPHARPLIGQPIPSLRQGMWNIQPTFCPGFRAGGTGTRDSLQGHGLF